MPDVGVVEQHFFVVVKADKLRGAELSDLGLLQTRFQEELQIEPVVFAYPYGFLCSESNPVLQELGIQMTLNCREQGNMITHDPECLYGLNRYNRFGNCETAVWMQRIAE